MPQPANPKQLDDLTQEDYEAYEEVRAEGYYNMLDSRARELTGLDRDTYAGILKHYSELAERYAA